MQTSPATPTRFRLLTAAQMRTAEAKLFQRTLSWEVMQHAGNAVAAYIMRQFTPIRTAVCCGPGNNGGDGWVVAETLRKAGWQVQVYAAHAPREYQGDAKLAATAYQGSWQPLHMLYAEKAELIVDALFGIGLHRTLEGVYVEVVAAIAASHATVISVDIPTGIDSDTGAVLGCAVRADVTITFAAKKIGHVVLPGLAHTGRLLIADIGILPDDMADIPMRVWENGKPTFPAPQAEDHKYTRGHVLIYGGAEMTGAARLAALAAARTGAGMVSVGVPVSAYEIYATSLLSVLVKRIAAVSDWKLLLRDEKVNACLIGPGGGLTKETNELLRSALQSDLPLVVDADGLTLLAQDPTLRKALKERMAPLCLTPHDGEYTRLARAMGLELATDKLSRARALAQALGVVLVLKGADTVIASSNGEAVVNTNAPPWLATAGSGDVLAGMAASLAAQGMNMFEAACAAVWLHGEAGAKAGAGLMAEDLLEAIPKVMG